MKILYIFKSFVLLAGMERILTDKMNYLSDQLGHDVFFISYEQGMQPLSYTLSSRIKHIDLNTPFTMNNERSYFKKILLCFKVRRLFRKRLYKEVRSINPDIIVSTDISSLQLDIILNASKKSRYVLESHVSNAFCRRAEFARFSLLRTAAWLYDCYVLHQVKKFDVMVTLTDADKRKWEKAVHSVTIPNFLTFYPQEIATLDEKSIISVGRLAPQKGFDLLIRAWNAVAERHPDWKVHIYGNGPRRNALQSQIKEAKLEDSFIIHNATPTIFEEYIKHSIYVMSSRFEGFGLVLIEAMSCGLPCISFDCPSGPSDIIEDNKDGIIVRNGDILKLSEAICRLIDDEAERKKMGAKARKSVLRYSKDEIMQQWDTFFKDLVNSKS